MTRLTTVRRAKPLPPLPTTAPSVLGPVAVERVVDLRDSNGVACLGTWTSTLRLIRLDASLPLAAAWHTYWHEWTHVALYDVGVKLKKAKEEQICDALATARVREMLDA